MKKEEELFTQTFLSPVGLISVEGNSKFISAVRIHNDNEVDVTPESTPVIDKCIFQLKAYFDGTLQKFRVPVKPGGNKLQAKVWKILREVPYNETLSYQTLSELAGDNYLPRVAAASGRSNMAIIVPCHRVVGSTYVLTGYAGGMWRKKWLMDHEARVARGDGPRLDAAIAKDLEAVKRSAMNFGNDCFI